MDDILFWLKIFRFLFLKSDAGDGTQGLNEYWAMLCHGASTNRMTLSYPATLPKAKTKQNKITVHSHHPVVFASFLVICSLCALSRVLWKQVSYYP